MSFLGLILSAIAKILHLLVNAYTIIIIARVILSWVRPDPYNPIVHFITQVAEPVLAKIRRLLPASFFQLGFDVSPLVVLILLILFETIVIGSLDDLAYKLRYG